MSNSGGFYVSVVKVTPDGDTPEEYDQAAA